MKNAFYIDTYSTNHLHEMFDAASLVMFASMYDHVEYRAASSSIYQVLSLLEQLPNKVSFSSISTVDENIGWRKARRFIKQLQAIIHNVWFILIAPKGCDIIINYNTLAALPIMNHVVKMTNKRVLQICHGELKELKFPHSQNILLKRGLALLQKRNIADTFFFAVLGKSIYENIMPLIGQSAQCHMLFFEHPAVFPKKINSHPKSTEKLIIGTIGSMRDSKGAEDVFELAKRLKNNPNVEFRSIGHLPLNPEDPDNVGIIIPENMANGYLSRDELYKQICQLDYALFLFPPEIYKYTASGSVLDAIACTVPIIAIKNDYFTSLFSQFGEFGYLEDNISAVFDRIVHLSELSTLPQHDMHAIQRGLNPQEVARQFAASWLQCN